MPLIICVFQTADDGSSGSHQFRKSSLRKTCLNAQIMDFACDGIICANLFQLGHSFRLARHKAAMQDFNGVAGALMWFLFHIGYSRFDRIKPQTVRRVLRERAPV